MKNGTKKDIQNREDIMLLVNAFYEKIKSDPVIGYLFIEVAQVNWEKHLPKMYDFWENILFYTGNFEGNPMTKHKELHQKSTLTEAHFQQWNALFIEAVDLYFKGTKAEEIKHRAKNISSTMIHKTLS